MATVIIDQAKTEEFRLGLEREGLNSYPTSTRSFGVPLVNGQWKHGLTPDEVKVVEAFYGRSFTKPEDREFWGDLVFTVKNHLSTINLDNPDQLLMISCMKQLGYCAASLEEVSDNPMANYVFVIKDRGQDEQEKLTLYQRNDEAIIELSKIRKRSNKELIALAFYLLPDPYHIGTNEDLAYTGLRDFIEGKYTEQKYQALDKFTAALEIPKDRLYVMKDVNVAVRKNIIRRNGKREYYNPISSVTYGATLDQVFDYMVDPKNDSEYGLAKDAPEYSIRKQLARINL